MSGASELDRLSAAWNRSKLQLHEAWANENRHALDAQWLADLRSLEEYVENAGDDILAAARRCQERGSVDMTARGATFEG